MFEVNLKSILSLQNDGIILYVAIGNTLRGDDGVGAYIINKLNNAGLNTFDAGEHPERILDVVPILNPKKVIIFDAANFDGTRGEIRLICEEDLSDDIFSTHRMPVQLIMRLVREDYKAEVYCIGIQVEDMGLKEGLSVNVQKTADDIYNLIKSAD